MTTTTATDTNRAGTQRLVATPLRHAAMITLAGLLLAACSPEPTPAEPTRVPEEEPTPQVVAGDATELRDAIQAPQDKARAVEDTLMQAADAQREAIDAAEGGEAAPPAGG